MTEHFDPDPDSATCERCGKTVLLDHNPPTACGLALCDTCGPDHDCEDHA